MKKERLGFYMWGYENVENVDYILSKLRKYYPTAPIVVSSDCGEDFSNVAEKHNAVKYIHGTDRHGHPNKNNRYGWTVYEASLWFRRFYEACTSMDAEYIMMMDEDLLINGTFDFPDADMIMHPIHEGHNLISPSGLAWVKSRGSNSEFINYGFGAGSILNIKSFITTYKKHIDDLLLNYESIFVKSFQEGNIAWGWNDNLVCALMYANNAICKDVIQISESGDESDPSPIVHNFRKYYRSKTIS